MKTQDHNRQYINTRRGWDINHWCEVFGIRSEDLLELVKKFGHDPQEIERRIKKAR
jgi:hypothetical protein